MSPRWIRRRLRLLTAALIVGLPGTVHALDPGKAPTQYQQDSWRSEHGLGNDSVGALLRDRRGYLWIGTHRGLLRFDGLRFVPLAGEGAPEGAVASLIEDRSGRLWIGVEGAIVRHGEDGLRRFAEGDGLPARVVACLLEDRAGRIWAGTRGGGLLRWDGARFEPVALAARRIRALAADGDGTVWAATEQGLARLGSDGSVRTFGTADGLSHASLFDVEVGRDGSLWVGGDGGVDRRRADGGWDQFGAREGLPSVFVRSLARDADGNLWVGTEDGGLARLRDDRAMALGTGQGLPSDSVQVLLADHEGLLWVGTDGGGLVRLRDPKVAAFTTREGLSRDSVLAIHQDRRGGLWLGTGGGGVNRVQDGRVTVFTQKDGLGSDTVASIAEEPSGTLWFACYGAGLSRLADGRFTQLTTRDGLPHDTVNTLLVARDGSLWIGGFGGLARLWQGRFTRFTKADGLPDDVVHALHEDSSGAIWVGTRGGLVRVEGGRLVAVPPLPGVSRATAVSFYEPGPGELWIGTSGEGLVHFKDGAFRVLTTRHGLPDDGAGQILPDAEGRLWISTRRGLFAVPARDLAAVADGKASRVTPLVFGPADGTRMEEFYGGSTPAGARARDGRLWFPTARGAIVVDPSRLPEPPPPPVVIEAAPLRVAAGRRPFEIPFTALALRAPERITFRYRLRGSGEEWVDAGSRRVAYYSGVAGGRYQFEVTATDETGRSLPAATLPVEVELAWHERRLVQAVLLLGLALVGYGLHRLRTWRLLREERRLVALVAERTEELRRANEDLARQNTVLADNVRLQEEVERVSRHDLRTPLASTITLMKQLRKTPGLGARQLELMRLVERSSYRVMDLVNLSVDMLKMERGSYHLSPRPVELANLARHVAGDLEGHARSKGVRIDVRGGPAWARGEELLCYSMLANLIKNAVEASPDGTVVSVDLRGGEAETSVRIHNRGAVPASLRATFFEKFSTVGKAGGTGLGTYSARLMASTQGGRIAMTTSDVEGTTLEVVLPAAPPEAVESNHPPAPQPVEVQAASSPVARGIEALIVDDDAIAAAMLEASLVALGVRVSLAVNGRAGLDAARRLAPDLVIADMEMPVMSGPEMVSRLRRDETGTEAPTFVVGLTAHEDPAVQERFRDAGCDRCLVKPIEPEDVEAVVAEVVRRGPRVAKGTAAGARGAPAGAD